MTAMLSSGDLRTYADLLRLEHDSIVSPTRDSLWDFMRVADAIGRAFDGIGNASLKQVVEGVFDDLADTQTSVWAIGARTFGDILTFEQHVLDPAKWTDAGKAGDVLGKAAAAQAAEVRAMLGSPLTLDACLELLHLLPGMLVAAPKERELAGRIVAAPVDSPEYPNDVFANQLVYAAALKLVDPDGGYALAHDALKAFLQSLHDLPRTNDPGTAALVQALKHHLNVADVDSAYPFNDPYAAGINFPVRKADTLAALNAAWKGLRT